MEIEKQMLDSNDPHTLEIRMTIVTALLATTIFNESLDSLKYCDFYNGKLKSASKQFEIQITNKCNNMVNDLWKFNEVASSDLTQSIRDVAAHIAMLKPSEIVTMASALKEGKLQFK
tara:strand:+ start:2223 stop:2573 length:351 start_codon:yes stop_codon:yes gene_type:complete